MKLNQKHGTTLMYHTRAGASSVGSVVWDLLYVMKDFDPKHVGFHWDTGHMALHGSNMWELLMRTAGPYVVAMGWKDRAWQQNLGFLGEGGPFPGPQAPPLQPAAGAGGGGGGGRGGARRAAAGAGGCCRRWCARRWRRRARRAADRRRVAAPGGEGRRSRRPRRWSRRRRRVAKFPLPLAGNTFARGGGWSSPYVPMGTGLVDIFRYATVLRDIGFDGPMELRGRVSQRRRGERQRQDHAAARAGDRKSEARRAHDPRRVRSSREPG